ncbi:MAG: hypothetical protein ACK5G7_01995 [Erysipelotrichaceae bacterium]
MDNYYIKLIHNIEKLISEQKYEEVKSIVEEELAMPYIPDKLESKLKEIYDLLNQRDQAIKVISDESELSSLLKGSIEEQLAAINSLDKLNARNYHQIIKDYFLSDPSSELAGLLIDVLINQGINQEFEYNNRGLKYYFIPKQLLSPAETDGFVKVMSVISDYLSNDYPDIVEICLANLTYYSYSILPLELAEEEAEDFAYYLAYQAFVALSNENKFFDVFNISGEELEKIKKNYDSTIL